MLIYTSETHAFLVHIDVCEQVPEKNTRNNIKFTRSIRKASTVDMRTTKVFQNPENLDRSLALPLGTMRILIIDDGLPDDLQVHTLSCNMNHLAPAQLFDHPDWLERLKREVDERAHEVTSLTV